MAIAYVRGATGAAENGTTCTIAFDATGCDCIVVGGRDTGTTPLITGVTYNGVAMTLGRHDGTSLRGSTMYYLTGPASGTNNVVISYSGGATGINAIVAGFSGVHQSSPIGNVAGRADSAGGSGTGPTVNVPITMSAGSVAVDFFVLTKGDSTVAPTPGGSQTGITAGVLQGDGFAYSRMSYLASATQMSWSWNGPSVQPQSHSVIELRVAAASTVSGVTVSPPTPTVTGGTTQAFTAVVAGTGSPSQSVTWSVDVGSINASTGLYTAPTTTGSIQTATVTATSVQDGAYSGTATVTIPAFSGTVTSVTVSPSAPSVTELTTQAFTAVVNGTGSPSQSVTWSASIGSINASTGVWTAPAATGSIQTATITATSVQNGAISGTASPTVPAAIVPVLSPGFRSVYAQSFQYEDRVKDTTTTTGTGTVTLADSAPTGYRTFDTVFDVGTERISYLIEDTATGAWEAGLGTLATGTTLSRDTILASSTGSAISFAAGTKNVFCAVTAAALKRFAVKDFIDLRDYDVDPTFTNDSTVGIQTAINDAFISGIQTIRIPVGHYKIAGALKSPDDFGRGCNGQLYIPASQFDTTMKHIRLIGESGPLWQYGALSDQPILTGGVVFESTLLPAAATGTWPSVICASYGYNGGWGFFNFTDLTIENIVIRTNTLNGASSMCGLDCHNMSNGPRLDNVRIDVNRGLRTNPDPTAKNSYGFIGTAINNSGMYKWGNVFIGGYCTAARFSEHMAIDRLTVYGCVNAVDLQDAYHASSINHLNVEGCKNSIVMNGTHALAVLCYDTEHNTPGTWFDFAYDIKRNSGTRKVTIVQSTVVKGGVGIDDSDWVSNATDTYYKVVAGAGAN